MSAGGLNREALQGAQHPLALYSSLLPSYGQPGRLH